MRYGSKRRHDRSSSSWATLDCLPHVLKTNESKVVAAGATSYGRKSVSKTVKSPLRMAFRRSLPSENVSARGGAGQCPEACPEDRLDCRTVSCTCPVLVLYLSYTCPILVLYLSCTCPILVLYLSCTCLVLVLWLTPEGEPSLNPS